VTRPEALNELRRLTFGLEPDAGGAERFLERLATHLDRPALVAVLVERGAQALLLQFRGRGEPL